MKLFYIFSISVWWLIDIFFQFIIYMINNSIPDVSRILATHLASFTDVRAAVEARCDVVTNLAGEDVVRRLPFRHLRIRVGRTGHGYWRFAVAVRCVHAGRPLHHSHAGTAADADRLLSRNGFLVDERAVRRRGLVGQRPLAAVERAVERRRGRRWHEATGGRPRGQSVPRPGPVWHGDAVGWGVVTLVRRRGHHLRHIVVRGAAVSRLNPAVCRLTATRYAVRVLLRYVANGTVNAACGVHACVHVRKRIYIVFARLISRRVQNPIVAATIGAGVVSQLGETMWVDVRWWPRAKRKPVSVGPRLPLVWSDDLPIPPQVIVTRPGAERHSARFRFATLGGATVVALRLLLHVRQIRVRQSRFVAVRAARVVSTPLRCCHRVVEFGVSKRSVDEFFVVVEERKHGEERVGQRGVHCVHLGGRHGRRVAPARGDTTHGRRRRRRRAVAGRRPVTTQLTDVRLLRATISLLQSALRHRDSQTEQEKTCI